MKNNTLKFIDLFAGIGGIRMPFSEQNCECVFTSEMDKYAQKTYLSYYNDQASGDITLINDNDIPDFDILLAGFPCQPFSQAGLKQGFSDTRGTLFFDIERILKSKKPKCFLLENVKGLKGHDKGNTFKTIIKSLEDLGYYVKFQVLSAKDFNLPQNRQRIYIIGFLNKEQFDNFYFPEPIKQTIFIKDILEKEVDNKYTLSDKLWAGHQRRKEKHLLNGNGFGYKMYNQNSAYVGTISARYYKDGSEILIEQSGKNPRMLTPLEAARLQGFPDELVIKAKKAGLSDAQLYKQFGNSVAVSVIRAISNNILKALKH